MAKLTNCLQIVNAMPEQDQDALLARLDELQAQGLSPKEAQLQAAIDVLAQVEREGRMRKSADRVTDTPEFKRWFGDSKVVDAAGNPLVVYHGTKKSFDEFKKGVPVNFENAQKALGYFFTDSADLASRFAGKKRGSSVVPVYLSIQNPKVIQPNRIGGSYTAIIESDFNDDEAKAFVEKAKAEGHDGFVFLTGEGFSEYVAFEPTQIKSATGNNGQFDPTNPSILKSADREANFKRWTKGLDVIEADFAGTYDGGPAVFQAFHGTTHDDIEEFKTVGSKEGALGQGPYFSTSVADVNENYAGVGPDLTSRIGREEDSVRDGFYDDPWFATEVLQDYFASEGIDTEVTDDNFEELKDEHGDKAITHAATARLKGKSDGLVMPVYVRLEKPFNMATSPTYFEMTYPVNEDGETDYDAEPEGSAMELINAIDTVAGQYDADASGLTGWVYENAVDGISAREVWDRAAKEITDLNDDNGDLISSGQFMQDVAREMGFDGLIQDADLYFGTQRRGFGGIRAGAMKGVEPGTLHIMPFSGEQVKSSTGNSGEFGENRQILKSPERPQFYSQLQRAIEQVPARLDNMGAMAWKQWLTANAPKLGVKAEEVEWSGIKDFLDLQGKRKLSKDELSGYLDDSGVKVSEVTLGGDGFYRDANGQRVFDDETGDFVGSKNPGTKYENYTLPGGENYRELLITLPGGVSGKELAALDERIQELEDDRDGADEDERDAIDQRIFAVQAERKQLLGKGYRSSHWDEPNVLAHIRVNDRTAQEPGYVVRNTRSGNSSEVFATREQAEAYQAKLPASVKTQVVEKPRDVRVLFVEEVQSDAGQDKRKGKTDWKAPFIDKTEGWLNLALKRIAMMAVEGGYDKVAFVNGEQSADRYDLSKSISSIAYSPEEKLLDAWDQNRRKVMRREITDESQLEDYIGKEVAKRLLATTPVMGKHLLDGEDLKVGGEGMKTFYDRIVPQAVNKLLPKLGGEKLEAVGIASMDADRRVDNLGYQVGEIQVKRDPNGNWFVERGEQFVSRSDPGRYWDGKQWVEDEGATRMFATKREATASVTATMPQPGFDVTDKMRETVGAGLPLFSRDRAAPDTPEFKKWFGDSKVVDDEGKPLVVYHGTAADITEFDPEKVGTRHVDVMRDLSGADLDPTAFYFTDDTKTADWYAKSASKQAKGGGNVLPVYLSMQNPLEVDFQGEGIEFLAEELERAKEGGYDGLIARNYDDGRVSDHYIAFKPTQIKSATGNNGDFDSSNSDIRKSTARKPWFEDLSKLKVSTNYQLGDLLKSSKKLSWWDRTVGTQYNLATKQPEFKRVFDAVQSFINDVSAYATRAADLAPTILPKLDGFADINPFSKSFKKPMSAEDVAALRDPVFGGTLKYARNENGEIYEEDDVQKAGVVFTNEELKSMFGLSDAQIGLYRQFRSSVDQSVTDLALSDMVRYLGEDGRDIAETVMASGNVDVAVGVIESHLADLAKSTPQRADTLAATTEAIQQKGEQANRLMDRGYAPLSRFGEYTVYVVGKNGEQEYFGMFESKADMNRMAREMAEQYPDAKVSTGTMSQESYKLFSGVTPETLALFGDQLGLEESGIDTKSEAFQAMLKVAKTNRSAMKRLIERKGIDGYSEDAGRVLAGFVYSNARQVSTNLHAGEIGKAAADVKDGDVKDAAIRLMEYIQNPQEEAQKLKSLLFTVFLGGNISSALVNFTQTATTTFPYLSQFDGAASVMKRLGDAGKIAARGIRNDNELKQALTRAEQEGIVSPQEVFHLMAQAQGKAQLRSGDGTLAGDAAAKANNFATKATLGWGRLFSAAEQVNRRIAFIAAFKLARDKGMASPFEFAEKAVIETQFSTNKGIRPAWARGAVGGVLFTFKGFTISYLELLGRMLGNGPEGKKAFGLALGVLFLFAGVGGLPFADDLDDVVDGFAQRVLGKSFDSKQAKKEFFASVFGQAGANFVMGGLTSLPGAPIDLSGRLGLGNIAPGTGTLPKKVSYQRDIMEVFGPAGSLFSSYATAAGELAQGDIAKAAKTASPVGIKNLIQGIDMATMGFYRDTKGRKVIDTNGWEAFAKSMGFQPASVKQVQEATSTQQGLVAQNRLAWQEIRNLAIAGRVERDTGKQEEARRRFAEWNRKNLDSPIAWNQAGINEGVKEANKDKARRISDAAPKAIKGSVKRELESESQ